MNDLHLRALRVLWFDQPEKLGFPSFETVDGHRYKCLAPGYWDSTSGSGDFWQACVERGGEKTKGTIVCALKSSEWARPWSDDVLVLVFVVAENDAKINHVHDSCDRAIPILVIDLKKGLEDLD